MLMFYLFLLFSIFTISNVYLIWLNMELMFLFFLLIVLLKESKSVGLIIYFFFQSVMSLILFISMIFLLDKIVFMLLIAKLGMFPFFYWMIIVSVKIGYLGNMFVLSLQKFSVFWLLWNVLNINFTFLIFMVYLSLFFVMISLFMTTDLWLLLVYSSIANTSLLLISIVGVKFFFIVFLYLFLVLFLVYLINYSVSYFEILFILFLFLVTPPFLLFFMKFYIFFSLDILLKMGFLISIFDIFILLYYFSIIFMKFMLMDMNIFIYFLNLLVCFSMMFFSNCVTLIIFYKS